METLRAFYQERVMPIVLSYAGDGVKESIVFEYPRQFGDLALPCFPLAKLLKKAPQKIAEEIAALIGKEKARLHLGRAEAVNGYVNLYCAPSIIPLLLDGYTTEVEKEKPMTAMVEYSSPNANKPQHLGHIRNNLLGMSLSLLLEKIGNNVIRANLVNDKGFGVTKTIFAYDELAKGKGPDKKPDHYVGDLYVLAEKHLKAHPEDEDKVRAMLRKWEEGDPQVRTAWKRIRDWVMEGYEKTYEELGCLFDIYYFESDIYEDAKPIIDKGLARGVFVREDNGAVKAPLGKHRLPDKVVLRADGTSLYVTNDLVLAEKKAKLAIDKSVYVVGNEQDLYFQQLFAMLKDLGYRFADQCYHFSYGMVSLPEGKMKSREGTVVDADDLMAEMRELAKAEILSRSPDLSADECDARAKVIGLGALKFFMLKVDPKKDMVFNPKESLSFEGETGPYVQYAATRIKSIMDKAEDAGRGDLTVLGADELPLATKLVRFHQTVADAALQMKPSLLANYLTELAQRFNEYYHAVPVLKAEEDVKNARLHLLSLVRDVLVEGLRLLVIDVPDKM